LDRLLPEKLEQVYELLLPERDHMPNPEKML
jgi:hypothetical protein